MSTTGGVGDVGAAPGRDPLAEVRDAAGFAAALTGLRVRRGMSIREVGRVTGVPSATLGGWFAGRHQPPAAQKAQLLGVLAALGVAPEDRERWWEALNAVRRVPGQRGARVAPYRGLEPYDVADADWFVGREPLAEELQARVRALWEQQEGASGLAVVGASGVGKSSVLRAGLLAALRAGGAETALLVPGGDPEAALAAAREQLAGSGSGGPAVLLVDQLEELFGDRVPAGARGAFLDALVEVATRPATAVVVALRADFYADAVAEPALLPWLGEHQVLVGPLEGEALRRVVQEPAARAGCHVEPELVELLLRDLAPRGGAPDAGTLPLLSHALLVTWSRARGGRLTVADYVASGGVAGAVQRTAEEVYAGLDEASRRTARRLFGQLVSVDEDGVVTRRRMHHAELAEDDPLASVIEAFVAGRILTATATTLEIGHEVLLAAWPRLAGWVEADREALVLHRRIARAAAEWDRAGRESDTLMRGSLLEQAREAVEAGGGPTCPRERDYVAASLEHAEARRRAAARRRTGLRALFAAVTVLALVTTLLSGYLYRATREADTQRAAAEDARLRALSRQVAAEAARTRETEPALAMQLALAAYRVAPTVEARSELLATTGEPVVSRLTGPQGPMRAVATADGGLLATAGSDGRVRLWLRTDDDRAPAAGGSLAAAGGGALFAAAFSPDGTALAVGGTAGVVTVVDVTDPDRPRVLQVLREPGATVQDLAWDPDGRTLVAATSGAAVHRWRWRGGRLGPSAPTGGFGAGVEVLAVAAAADHTVATGSSDGTVRLWRPAGDGMVEVRRWRAAGAAGAARVRSVAFSPDGRLVAAGATDAVVRIWEVAGGREAVEPLTGFDSWVNALAFDPDGSALAAAASGGLVQVWDTATWEVRHARRGPANLTSVQFVGGRRLLSGAIDGVAQLVALDSPRLEPFGDSVWGLAAPVAGPAAGRRLYVGVGSADPMVAVVDVGDPRHPRAVGERLRGPDAAGTLDGVLAVSPDGSLLVAGTSTGKVVAWRVPTTGRPELLGVLDAAAALVENIAFSADGSRFAVSADDGSATVFAVGARLPRRVARWVLDGGLALGVAMSPDGSLVAVGGSDNAVHLLRVAPGGGGARRLAVLEGFENYVYGAAFSPDGRTLAASGADGTVRLWDVARPDRPAARGRPLRGPADTVFAVGFDPSGGRVAGASQDGRVWVWELDGEGRAALFARLDGLRVPLFQVLAHRAGGADVLTAGGASGVVGSWVLDPVAAAEGVCAVAGAPVTEAEWERHVPGAPYDPPC